jgi:hypothetical protein
MIEGFRCPCQTCSSPPGDQAIAAFAKLRTVCPALNQVFIPDSLWPRYRAFLEQPPDGAHHMAGCFGAFHPLGQLPKLTLPVHRFLLENRNRRPVAASYLGALQEKWVLEPDHLSRHHALRQYLGKVTELLLAENLRNDGWHIDGLEAWGDQPDILAQNASGRPFAIEVKRIGELDETYAAIAGNCSDMIGYSSAIAADYVLTRLYEATYQFGSDERCKVGCLVCFSIGWLTLQKVFDKHIGIDWTCPALSGDEDEALRQIRARLVAKRPSFPHDLAQRISILDEVWVLREDRLDLDFLCRFPLPPDSLLGGHERRGTN